MTRGFTTDGVHPVIDYCRQAWIQALFFLKGPSGPRSARSAAGRESTRSSQTQHLHFTTLLLTIVLGLLCAAAALRGFSVPEVPWRPEH